MDSCPGAIWGHQNTGRNLCKVIDGFLMHRFFHGLFLSPSLWPVTSITSYQTFFGLEDIRPFLDKLKIWCFCRDQMSQSDDSLWKIQTYYTYSYIMNIIQLAFWTHPPKKNSITSRPSCVYLNTWKTQPPDLKSPDLLQSSRNFLPSAPALTTEASHQERCHHTSSNWADDQHRLANVWRSYAGRGVDEKFGMLAPGATKKNNMKHIWVLGW
jgi:hypothetical protein